MRGGGGVQIYFSRIKLVRLNRPKTKKAELNLLKKHKRHEKKNYRENF